GADHPAHQPRVVAAPGSHRRSDRCAVAAGRRVRPGAGQPDPGGAGQRQTARADRSTGQRQPRGRRGCRPRQRERAALHRRPEHPQGDRGTGQAGQHRRQLIKLGATESGAVIRQGAMRMMKRNLLVIGLAGLLSACGFPPRGTGDAQVALKELDVSPRDAYGDTVTQVREVLENNGVRVYAGAPYKLVLTRETENRRSASFSSGARTAEYELTMLLDYEIRGTQNLLLTGNTVEVQNYYQQDDNNLAGADQEAAQLRNELRREMIRQLTQNLQQITPEQLDQLQQTAEARARAEAEALEAARRARESQVAPQQSPIELPSQ